MPVFRRPASREFLVRQGIFLLPLLLMLLVLEIMGGGASLESIYFPLRHDNALLTQGMFWLTSYGNGLFYGVYLILLIFAWKRKSRFLARLVLGYVLMQIFITVCGVQLLKWSLGRPRPYSGASEWVSFSSENGYHSLPSGHTADASASCGPLGQFLRSPWSALVLGIFPALMGFTRIYLGAHHSSDVLAGALVGSFATWCIMRFAMAKNKGTAVASHSSAPLVALFLQKFR